MSLLTLIIVIIAICLILYAVSLVPMDARMKLVIQALIVLFFALWLLHGVGVLDMRID